MTVRRAVPDDAEAMTAVLAGIVAEGGCTAIETPWTAAQQREYLRALSPREAFHVAVDDSGAVAGYQSLDLWSSMMTAMAHVGQVGTFLAPQARSRGVGRLLFSETVAFGREQDYRKFVVQVRGSNLGAQAFYAKLGFRECGRLTRQVRLAGVDDDEVMMEFFL